VLQYGCWRSMVDGWRYASMRCPPAPTRRSTGGLTLPVLVHAPSSGPPILTKGNLWYLHSWPSGFTACRVFPAARRSSSLLRVSLMVGGLWFCRLRRYPSILPCGYNLPKRSVLVFRDWTASGALDSQLARLACDNCSLTGSRRYADDLHAGRCEQL
jgi:hypothetical protein